MSANPARAASGGSTYIGKWLIWVRCQGVETCWGAVRSATEAGSLGIAAKIRAHRAEGIDASTAKATDELTFSDLLPPAERHVVCVYTRDWRDVDDVGRVGRALAQIGAVRSEIIRYKSDEQTLSGIYYGGRQSVSLYEMRAPYTRLAPGAGLRSDWLRDRHGPDVARILTLLGP